jgi:LPS-assembly lipoprotein
MQRRCANYMLIIAISCLLGACGFQLRGTGNSAALPDSWKSMQLVTGNPNGELSRTVQTVFATNGVDWSAGQPGANYTLVLGPERFSQSTLSLNSAARVSQLELTLRASFSVQDAKNQQAMPEATASVIRQMENDPYNAMGKAEEVRILKVEMRTELAQQIMRRIGFYASSLP